MVVGTAVVEGQLFEDLFERELRQVEVEEGFEMDFGVGVGAFRYLPEVECLEKMSSEGRIGRALDGANWKLEV